MRSLFLRTSLFAALVCPLAAHASTTITITPTSGAATVYTLEAGTGTFYTGYFTEDAFLNSTTQSDLLFFYDTADGGGMYDSVTMLNLGGTYNATTGATQAEPQIFSGSPLNPKFVNSSVVLPVLTPDSSADTGAFDTVTVSATPEPSSLMLLGTGAAGLVTAFRRRRRV